MKNRDKGFIHRAADAAIGLIILLWVLKWCFTTRLGAFLLMTVIGGLGAVLMIGGVVNAIAWNCFNDYSDNMTDSGWFWAICFLGSAIFSLDYMAGKGLFNQMKPVEDEEED